MQTKGKNAHLKGRKRFAADLIGMVDECTKTAIEANGLQAKHVKAGDEEGSIEIKIFRDGKHFIAVNLLIDDTSSYPLDHTFLAFALDADIPPHLLKVLESVSNLTPEPIVDTVKNLLVTLAISFSEGKYIPEGSPPREEHDDDAESDGQVNYDDDFNFIDCEPTRLVAQSRFPTLLRDHFHEIIKVGCKPGVTRLADNELVLSVSHPVPSLPISPRALVAWDRRLLLSYHNLTLLISGIHNYPLLDHDGVFAASTMNQLKFHVGLSSRYKPSKEVILDHVRNFGTTRVENLNDSFMQAATAAIDDQSATLAVNGDPGRFEKFSLSSSLESVLSNLVPILQLRHRFQIGWAGAEILYAGATKYQQKYEYFFSFHEKDIRTADQEEAQLYQTYSLPLDLLTSSTSSKLNLPLLAYSYLVRRFMLCSRYCLVCHSRIATNFEALKPYVCDAGLCTYQYYALNIGTSIEYEICNNPQVVDLLVSLAYVGAWEQQLSESLPVGLSLRVPVPKPPLALHGHYPHTYTIPGSNTEVKSENAEKAPSLGSDGLCEFDELPTPLMRAAIVEMIDMLPPIADMKRHLERRIPGHPRPQLRSMDEKILPAAWLILRWCVASSTAHLECVSEDERIPTISAQWRQFRFSVGAAAKEARFQAALAEVQSRNSNARQYPTLYGFHGSSLKNWYIIRQGLLVKDTPVHGRSFGNGVYFAKDGGVSMNDGYAQSGQSCWRNSEIKPRSCVALAELVNSPTEYTSSAPYYVIEQVDWILCRYLLVRTDYEPNVSNPQSPLKADGVIAHHENETPADTSGFVRLDPSQPLTMGTRKLLIPEQSHKLQMLLDTRKAEQPTHDDFDEEDSKVLGGDTSVAPPQLAEEHGRGVDAKQQWHHDEAWCDPDTYQLLPPPTESTPQASLAVNRELRVMLREQEKAMRNNGLAELGDNVFRWMVELHSFDASLPVAQDMVRRDVPSILFEIRFPPTFPIQPPFFRIIKPRFLPFILVRRGGHVTGGGSICMDLLVSDGKASQYVLSAILLQVKLAISNPDPRPARLAADWNR
ncbi:hypothetical protein JB92DRAFT_3085748 [Gautieria morchelliformis]|nr:hypothetical protein JB92DRAFT_3085748 [Gautieria morchelliformis]